MEFYFFRTLPALHKAAFDAHYSRQNLKAVQVSAAIITVISVSYAILNLIFNFGDMAPKNHLYLKVNNGMILASALTFGASLLPRIEVPFFRSTAFTQALCFGYGLYYALSCLAICFLQQENPQKTLVMFLLGLTVIAIIWNFEYWQHLLLALIIEGAFIFGLYRLPPLPITDLVLNYLISVAMIIFFFVAGRLIYSFRASQFMQLAEIAEKNQKLEQISQTRAEIMGIVAHDLLSPFATIESLIKLLRKQKLSPQQQEEYFELVQGQCKASRNLINSLLEATKYENEKTIITEKTELNGFLDQFFSKWQTQLKDLRNLDFVRSPAPVFAHLNRERFSRVLDNLLTNAVKFTPANGNIFIGVKRHGRQVVVNVSDNGIGIPKKLQPFLFQRFSKARRTGLQGQTTTGLGLNIAQELVNQHGGRITVESAENQGTTFKIILPAV